MQAIHCSKGASEMLPCFWAHSLHLWVSGGITVLSGILVEVQRKADVACVRKKARLRGTHTTRGKGWGEDPPALAGKHCCRQGDGSCGSCLCAIMHEATMGGSRIVGDPGRGCQEAEHRTPGVLSGIVQDQRTYLVDVKLLESCVVWVDKHHRRWSATTHVADA